jgi:hypothetical protein
MHVSVKIVIVLITVGVGVVVCLSVIERMCMLGVVVWTGYNCSCFHVTGANTGSSEEAAGESTYDECHQKISERSGYLSAKDVG